MLSILFSASMAGAETPQQYKLQLADFNELVVVDGINVEYVCDPARAGSVEFKSTKDVASAVIFEPKNGKLRIMLAQRDTPITGLPTITVYSTYLTRASNEGDSLLHIHTPAPQGKMALRLIGNGRLIAENVETTSLECRILSGNGTLTVSGKALNAKLSTAGTGHIVASELVVSDAACSITGTGSIIVNVSESLTASGIGSGNIYYIGTPASIKKKFLSTVKVNPYKQ